MNHWLIFGAVLSTSLLAQQVTNAPSSGSTGTAVAGAPTGTVAAPSTPAPTTAAKSSSRKAGKKNAQPAAKKKDPAAELRTVPLVPGPAVVDAQNVNVRGQPRLKGEVITRLSKGQPVTVLEEITRNNSGPDEPSAWAKILLPTNVTVWVHSSFIDPANKTVRPRKLNLRGGPGENYSVLGQLVRGEAITEIGAKGGWIEIQPPTNAYAFMAAQYLKQELPSAAPTTPPETVAAPATVTEAPTVAAAPTEPPATPPTEPAVVAPAPTEPAATTNVPPVAIEEPPPKRIVQREGVVRGTVSIQAPTRFALYSLENGRMMDYLYTTSPNLDLRRYKGLHIIVTGEEGIEERWGNTPVITIQKIQVID